MRKDLLLLFGILFIAIVFLGMSYAEETRVVQNQESFTLTEKEWDFYLNLIDFLDARDNKKWDEINQKMIKSGNLFFTKYEKILRESDDSIHINRILMVLKKM